MARTATVTSEPPAETHRFLRENGHWTSIYTLLQENLKGEAGMVVLTGGADVVVEEDGIDRGNSPAVEEGVPKLAP
jgi:hypothetical protein